ncbi:hypothetical protein AGOR_G00251200 [Albula goreensis]|uniref:Uncharacterized protein n=1 Tax=Albula goreensis TaxID=1534307 RepID=A0A8T3CF31_9TELE|nr:hypothetical protein AGOR_G00251200 [Albula goreensis]
MCPCKGLSILHVTHCLFSITSSSIFFFADITPSLNSTLDTSNAVTPLPTERMKRKLLDFENEGVKRARVNYPQSDEEDITAMPEQFISYNDDVDGNFTEKGNELKEPVVVKGKPEDNQDGTESAGREKKKTEEPSAVTPMALPPLTQIKEEVNTNTEMDNAVRVKEEEVEEERNEGSSLEEGPTRFGIGNEKPQQLLLEERDQNNEEVQPFSMNGDQDGMIMEAVTQERDHHRMEMEITSEERDQFNKEVQPISRDQDQYSMDVETIILERDRYREQVNQLTSKLKKFEELLSKNNKERDELKVKCERLQKELENVKRETQGRALQNGQHTEHSKVKM